MNKLIISLSNYCTKLLVKTVFIAAILLSTKNLIIALKYYFECCLVCTREHKLGDQVKKQI